MTEAPTISQLESLSRGLEKIHALGDVSSFAAAVLSELPRLIPSEMTSVCVMEPTRRRSIDRVLPEEVANDPQAHETWLRYMKDCPTVTYAARTGDGRAKKLSDFWSQREFLDTGIYSDHYRPKHVDQIMAGHICLPHGTVIGFGVHRRGMDFSERERSMLDLLRPHIEQAYASALAFTALAARVDALGEAIRAMDVATITLDGASRIEDADTRAITWLSERFADWPLHASTLPETLDRWLREQLRSARDAEQSLRPRRPLLVGTGPGRLVIRVVTRAEGATLVIQHLKVDEHRLADLGCSPRETQVLHYVARGASNAEIASALHISERTVKKHLENMYAKLGVGNRTELAALAWRVTESAIG